MNEYGGNSLKFIEVTTVSGVRRMVNFDLVDTIVKRRDESGTHSTIIFLDRSSTLDLMDLYDDLKAAIGAHEIPVSSNDDKR